MMATNKVSIPMPPNHCIRLLQNKTLFGITSISVNILAPVVVKPETDSKTELANEPK
jgi:hypothetical protein